MRVSLQQGLLMSFTLRKGRLSRLYPANIQDISHPGPHDILTESAGSMHIS